MEMETAPLSEAERLYLGSRIPLLIVLFVFCFAGVIVALIFLQMEWESKPYGFIALLILNMAAGNLLWTALRKQWHDAHAGKKWVLKTTLTDKFTREKRTTQYFLNVNKKEYRVTQKAFEMYQIGEEITVFFAFKSKSWLGFALSAPKAHPEAPTPRKD